jgi:hypothetical protein
MEYYTAHILTLGCRMQSYYELLAPAVARLEENTGDARRAHYDRARTALVAQLWRGFMLEPPRPKAKLIVGPDGSPLTIADLPAPGTKRWVIRRKAEVVAAVRGGLLSLQNACSRYTLTVEEFLSWQHSIEQHGLAGLRITRIQQYRIAEAATSVAADTRSRTGTPS